MNMKSRAELLRALYSGILDDARSVFPDSMLSFERDNTRIQKILNRNEIWFFTITLPSWSKLLTKGLEDGYISSFEGAHSAPVKGKVFPRLFSGLFDRIFENNGMLREDADHKALKYLQTLLNAAKKLRMQCDDKIVVSTVQSFVDTEEGVRHHTLNWGDVVLHRDTRLSITGDGGKPSSDETRDLFREFIPSDLSVLPSFGTIQSVADWIVSGFGSPFYRELKPHHGPGAISDRDTNASKYQFSNWSDKLEYCFPASEFGVPNSRYWVQPVDEADSISRFRDTPVPSKLVAVPKTQKGPRLIAAEPVANMWMQQAIRGFLEDAVLESTCPLRHCISFRDQTKSGELALKSSLTRSHATIDLSDASDRLSCWLIERLFRSNYDLLQSFNAVRTDCIGLKRDRKILPLPKGSPKLIKLKKFSTQGSALTFPVQTIVYSLVAIGCLLHAGGHRVSASNLDWAAKQVRVFGDDIIVPNDITGQVTSALEALGFKVNANKTFTKGNFRESCGVDGYMGQDVTPTYVLEPYNRARPTSIASMVECVNNFYKSGFYHTSQALKMTLPESIRKDIPSVGLGSGAFGFVSHEGFDIAHHRSRVNGRTFKREILVLNLSARPQKTKFRGDFALHQYFTEAPNPTSKWENGEARRPKSTIRLRWVPTEMLV